MTQVTYPLINLDAVRATILDICGIPAWGNAVTVASDSFTQVAVSPQYDAGTAIQVKNGKGRFDINRPAEPELLNLLVSVTFIRADPGFFTALTGQTGIYDDAGTLIGFTLNRRIRPADVRVALEGWMDAFIDGCEDADVPPYGYFLWPFLSGGQLGDYTIENNAVNFVINNMVSHDGAAWGEGPYEVASDSLGAAQVLFDAVDDRDHQITFRTTIAPPANTGGLVPLDDPDGVDATTATAGMPGTWNGVRPETLVELRGSAITGSGGVTAWTTGQYVILGDGSYAHWAGSGATPKWVEGKA
jgi:hypothetical protein